MISFKQARSWVAGLLVIAPLLVAGVSPAVAQLDASQTWGGTASGTANAPVVVVSNISVAADLIGVPLRFIPGTNNSGATTLTVTLDGGGTIGPLNIRKVLGGSLVALSGGELRTSVIASVVYDGTQFQCTSCGISFTTSKGIVTSTNDVQLSLTNATLSGSPSNPTKFASVAQLMLGIGASTCRITPVYSTRVLVTISGDVTHGTGNSTVNFTGRYGSGAGPANGAAATGTAFSQSMTAYIAVNSATATFSMTNVIPGLTPGTTYWFDLSFGSSDTSTVNGAQGITCTAMEF